ncbi:MAG: PmoA family protein [Planctomycetes bacterium]|nr:PmoA family protein [Planctomycetota bacterium]
MTMRPILTALLLCGLLAVPAAAAEKTFRLTVAAGDVDRTNTPVCANVRLPKPLADATAVTVTTADGTKLPGQLTKPGLLSKATSADGDDVARELHFVLPGLEKGRSATLTVTVSSLTPEQKGFLWKTGDNDCPELSRDGRPVLRYMCLPFDDSTPERRHDTYKVFHHLYNPAGTRVVTKGPGGQYTHHRGLFFGFNRISYGDGGRVDTWHCTGDTHLTDEGVVSEEAGPVLGRHTVRVDWHGKGKEVFVRELRQMTVYAVPGGQLVEFASRLESTVGNVTLDGDPQHAGFQFRAAQEVAAGDQKATYYLRPDGKGQPGETRNWPGNKDFINLPWNAMSFVIDGQRYTAVYLDKPTNPKEARFSERTYGRFGSYFKYELTEDAPLEVDYRVWLQDGEMTVDGPAALSADFVEPVKVTVQ